MISTCGTEDGSTLVDRSQFIHAMRGVATGVSVVTTAGTFGQAGATVSAFASLSADPPSILVCLKGDSRIAAAVKENGQFALNVLRETSEQLALRFAGAFDDELEDRFADLRYEETNSGLPVLPSVATFEAVVSSTYQEGSHTIICGRVTKLHANEHLPLIYRDSKFHRIKEIEGDNANANYSG